MSINKKHRGLKMCVLIISIIVILLPMQIILSHAEEEIKEPDCTDGIYQISSVGELKWYVNYVNTMDSSVSARLVKSINMREKDIDGIGSSENPFKGTFDGNGKKIVGLDDSDIFSYSAGRIVNLKVEGGTIEKSNAAAICNRNYGEIINCSSTSKVSGCTVSGICVYNEGTIAECYNEGLLEGDGKMAGICAYNTGNIINCYNSGTIRCNAEDSSDIVAGIAINMDNGTVSNSISYGELISNNDNIHPIANQSYSDCFSLEDEVDFASGEVTYLLNNSSTDDVVWGQQIGKDNYPSFNKHTVYYGYDKCMEKYANEPLSSEPVHEYDSEWSYDGSTHFHKCNYCDSRADEEDHNMTEYRHVDIENHMSNCTVCSYEHYQKHNWNEGTITTEPTSEVNGMCIKDCPSCNAKKEVEIGLDIELPILDAVNYIQEEGFIATHYKIEIKASDARTGISEIYYSFIPNDKVIDDNVVENVTWNKYDKSFEYDKTSYDSLYIKVIDKCNNYIITDAQSAVLLKNNEKGNKHYWIRDIRSY